MPSESPHPALPNGRSLLTKATITVAKYLTPFLGAVEEKYEQRMRRFKELTTRVENEARAASYMDEPEKFKAVPTCPATWRNLLPENPKFHGRDDVLKFLNKTLLSQDGRSRGKAVSIHGLGGVGKTQVALRYAHQHLDDYPYIFWLSADTEQKLGLAVGEVMKHLSPSTSDPSLDIAKSKLLMKNWLIENGT